MNGRAIPKSIKVILPVMLGICILLTLASTMVLPRTIRGDRLVLFMAFSSHSFECIWYRIRAYGSGLVIFEAPERSELFFIGQDQIQELTGQIRESRFFILDEGNPAVIRGPDIIDINIILNDRSRYAWYSYDTLSQRDVYAWANLHMRVLEILELTQRMDPPCLERIERWLPDS